MGVYQFARGSVSRDSSLVIGLYRQPLTTVSSAGVEGREACLLQPESPSALFTLITQHNIGHPTPQIKLHYIKETLDQRVILMHAHVKVADRTPELWPDLDRETHMKNSVWFFPPQCCWCIGKSFQILILSLHEAGNKLYFVPPSLMIHVCIIFLVSAVQ